MSAISPIAFDHANWNIDRWDYTKLHYTALQHIKGVSFNPITRTKVIELPLFQSDPENTTPLIRIQQDFSVTAGLTAAYLLAYRIGRSLYWSPDTYDSEAEIRNRWIPFFYWIPPTV